MTCSISALRAIDHGEDHLVDPLVPRELDQVVGGAAHRATLDLGRQRPDIVEHADDADILDLILAQLADHRPAELARADDRDLGAELAALPEPPQLEQRDQADRDEARDRQRQPHHHPGPAEPVRGSGEIGHDEQGHEHARPGRQPMQDLGRHMLQQREAVDPGELGEIQRQHRRQHDRGLVVERHVERVVAQPVGDHRARHHDEDVGGAQQAAHQRMAVARELAFVRRPHAAHHARPFRPGSGAWERG